MRFQPDDSASGTDRGFRLNIALEVSVSVETRVETGPKRRPMSFTTRWLDQNNNVFHEPPGC